MRFWELQEAVGRITKQNQTSDVGPQEIKTQAAKFGNTVDKDGRPPTLSKKTKGSKTNVLFNLGLTESQIDELNIPRNQMPQISMKDLENDYQLRTLMVDPSKLETSQDQRIPGMVDKTVKSIQGGFNKPIVIDKNGFIVNGHHRYDAYVELGYDKIPAVQVTDASIQELISAFSHTAKDTYAEHDVTEKWSKKYKDSIDCSNPKGFSQKAHCAGKKKKKNEDVDLDTKIDLDNALKELPERLQQIVAMRVKHNMTFREIGNEIGTGANRAKILFDKALHMLRHPDKGIVGKDEIPAVVDRLNRDYERNRENLGKIPENFADGKKKGKSRPGRAKRAGIDCSKSVTALRKQAKNSSGEKQKMAHWCANMKSGRKKS